MTTLDHMQMRLFAAAGVFWLAGCATGSMWLLQSMAMCAFFALAVIPIRLIFASVEITGALVDSWTGARI